MLSTRFVWNTWVLSDMKCKCYISLLRLLHLLRRRQLRPQRRSPPTTSSSRKWCFAQQPDSNRRSWLKWERQKIFFSHTLPSTPKISIWQIFLNCGKMALTREMNSIWSGLPKMVMSNSLIIISLVNQFLSKGISSRIRLNTVQWQHYRRALWDKYYMVRKMFEVETENQGQAIFSHSVL